MPKVTVRKDGTCFIKASPVPGSGLVRVWEVRKEGIAWLRRQGVGVEQEMGRRLFVQLLDLGHAYIANRSNAPKHRSIPRKVGDQVPRHSIADSGGGHEVGTPAVATQAQAVVKPAPKLSKKHRRKRRGDALGPGHRTSLPPATEAISVPEHWTRRTKKKDWFG